MYEKSGESKSIVNINRIQSNIQAIRISVNVYQNVERVNQKLAKTDNSIEVTYLLSQ